MFRRIYIAFTAAITVVLLGFADGSKVVQAKFESTEVKAMFIYNFTKFVYWSTEEKTNDEIHIGVIGNDKLGMTLEDIFEKKLNLSAHNSKVKVIQFNSISEIDKCQLLYVAQSEQAHLSTIIAKVADKKVLTIAEIPTFCEAGGVINFTDSQTKYGFEINLVAAKRAKLQISSKLLTLASICKK